MMTIAKKQEDDFVVFLNGPERKQISMGTEVLKRLLPASSGWYYRFIRLAILVMISNLAFMKSNATISITATAINICTPSFPSSYQSISFSMTETKISGNGGFTNGQSSKTLVLELSANLEFRTSGVPASVIASGTEITVHSFSYTNNRTLSVTISTAALNLEYNTLSFNNFEVRAVSTGNGTLDRNGGTLKIKNKTTIPVESLATVRAESHILYSSSSVTQSNTSWAYSGTSNNLILGIPVVFTGTCNPASVTQFSFNLNGGNSTGTSNAADISVANVYYTGTINSFNPVTGILFGSVASPSGVFNVNGNITITEGDATHYFWLSYDLISNPTNGNLLDAQIVSVTAGGTARTDQPVKNPVGSRTISNNKYYSIVSGSWNNPNHWSYVDGGPSCSCTPSGNGYVVISPGFTMTNNVNTTVDYIDVMDNATLNDNGSGTLLVIQSVNTYGTGRIMATSNWTINGNLYFLGSNTSTTTRPMTVSGDFYLASGSTFSLTGAAGSDLTLNGYCTIDGAVNLNARSMNINSSNFNLGGLGNIFGSGAVNLNSSINLILNSSNITIEPNFNINGAFTLTNFGGVTLKGNLNGSVAGSTWVNAVNSRLTVMGSILTTGTLTATADGNTVTYGSDGAQNIKNTTYHHLRTNSTVAAVKSLTAALVVNGNLSILGASQLDVTGSNWNINLKGNWINNSSHATPFNHRTGTVNFTSRDTIQGSTISTFNIVNINATGTLYGHADNMIVKSNWINDGDFIHNAGNVTFDGTTTISGASTTIFEDITVNATRTLTAHATQTDLDGDFANNGTFAHNNGIWSFTGVLNQFINGTGTFTFYKLSLDRSTSNALVLNRPVTVSNQFILNTGKINSTSTNLPIVASTATITGGSSSSYVNGPMNIVLAAAGTWTRSFPVGKGNKYGTVEMTVVHSNNTSVTYTGEMFSSSAQALGYTLPGSLTRVSFMRYWTVSRQAVANLTSASVKLSYDSWDGVSESTTLRVARTNGAVTTWTDAGGTGSALPSGTITSSSFTTFGTFTFGNGSGGNNTLPVTLLSFEGKNVGQFVHLTWTTLSERNCESFIIEKSANGKDFVAIGTIQGSGNSDKRVTYYFSDDQPHLISYYRLLQKDYDGTGEYSNVITIALKSDTTSVFKAFPNPTRTDEGIYLNLLNSPDHQFTVYLQDINGKEIFRQDIEADNDGGFLIRLDPEQNLSRGIYLVLVKSERSAHNLKLMVK